MNTYYKDIFKVLLKDDLIKHFDNFEGKKEGLEKIIEEFFSNNDFEFKEVELEKQTKTTNKKCKDREKYSCKENRCKARTWNSGRGGQCGFTGKFDGFCKKHYEKKDDWWLGTVDCPRPERPIHENGKIHYWMN